MSDNPHEDAAVAIVTTIDMIALDKISLDALQGLARAFNAFGPKLRREGERRAINDLPPAGRA